MRRFLIDPARITDNQARLQGAEARHLQKVLRLGPGERVTLFTGDGRFFLARIDHLRPGEVTATILDQNVLPLPRVALHLGQGLLKGKKMEMVLQKATELGVAAIHPFSSQHCVGGPVGPEKQQRWQRIILEACKQCNQPRPPVCRPPLPLTELIETTGNFPLRLLISEREQETSLADLPQPSQHRHILCLLGPEGGFSQEEHHLAVRAGFLPVSLGSRILRAETASIAVVAILQHLAGNLAPRKPPRPRG